MLWHFFKFQVHEPFKSMEAKESNPNIVEEDINLGTNTKQKGISLKDFGNNENIDPGYHQVVQFSSTTWKTW